MASTIYFLKNFNNYYNRIIKKYDTVQEYLNVVGTGNYAIRGNSPNATNIGGLGSVNFNINDGITSEITYNYENTQTWQPDYVLVADESDNILYRFFVIEAVRTRRGQYHIQLRRDVIADHYTEVLNADTYIEKGSLTLEDPYIFNKEPLEFNQIKQNEYLLKDKTGCPWIVGFIASNQPESTETSLAGQYSAINSTNADKTYNSMSAAPFWNYLTDYGLNYWPYKVVATSGYNTYFFFTLKFDSINGTQSVYFTYKYNESEGLSNFECYVDALSTHSPYTLKSAYSPSASSGTVITSGNTYNLMNSIKNSITESMIQGLISYAVSAGNLKSPNDFNTDLKQYNGDIIYVNQASSAHPYTAYTYPQGYYQFNLSSPVSGAGYGGWSDYADYTTGSIVRGSTLDNSFRNMMVSNFGSYITTEGGSYDFVTMMCESKMYGVYMDTVYNANVTIQLNGNEKALSDSPYRMFCMPYNDNDVKIKVSNSLTITSDKNVNMSIAQAISSKLSGTWLYDLQLVPYCPFAKSDKITVSGNTVNIDISGLDSDYVRVATGNVGVMIFCDTSELKDLIITKNILAASEPIERKVNNQCDFYRLCAPSYSSIYEFNAERNKGVDNFNIDFNYKPHDTYIHVAPNFKGLYGSAHDTYNDIEGLICMGSFSLPQTSSQWQEFVLNNMNYKLTFENDIQMMDSLHDIDMTMAKWKVASGAVTGAAAGAVTGSMVGSVPGAIAGAAIGGIASTAAGIADVHYAQKRYDIERDRSKAKFNENNQNIKARNRTLNNVSSYNANNKVFPILEYYSCTSDEKDSFRTYLNLDGMTVGRYDKIANFIRNDFTFIQGTIRRCIINGDDFHMSTEISDEISKGVFIK